jgi:hypothetical protein
MNCVLSGTKISILFHLNDEIVKKTAEKTSFLTFQGDFMCKMALKMCDCGRWRGFFYI